MKTALIFGHTSGLGHEVSKKFLDAGYRVVGIARHSSDISSSKLIDLKADLSRRADTLRIVDQIKEQYSSFDVLIAP